MQAARKFRKRPVVIEAMQFMGEPDESLKRWLGDWFMSWVPSQRALIIRTLESNYHTASAGDYVIKGVANEFYACKPDIFEQTYEPADDTPRYPQYEGRD